MHILARRDVAHACLVADGWKRLPTEGDRQVKIGSAARAIVHHLSEEAAIPRLAPLLERQSSRHARLRYRLSPLLQPSGLYVPQID